MNTTGTLSTALIASLFFALPCFAVTVSISDHGAIGDGKTMNTTAIQATVDEVANKSGGTVLVPAGVWVTGSIQLKSHIELHLEPGAVLQGSSNIADYPAIGFQHLEMGPVKSLIWALHQADISITGQGIIDLNDKPFFQWDRLRTGLPRNQDSLLADWQRQQCVVTALPRPQQPNQPIFFHDCKALRLEGITVRNAPCWTIDFSDCQDIQVHAIRVDNNLQVPNNDGIHFSGSKNIVVSDCIISGGDDSLAFTGITDPSSVCEHIAVTNCILTARSAGVRLGHLSGKVRDVTLSNLIINDCNRGFAIQASDGGWVENVLIDNIAMETHMYAGAWWGKGEPFIISAADSDTGHIRGISISHLRARSENSIIVVGKNQNVSEISLSDIDLTFNYSPNSPLYGKQLDIAPARLRPSKLNQDQLPWIYSDDVVGLDLRNIRFRKAADETHNLVLDPSITNVKDLTQTEVQ